MLTAAAIHCTVGLWPPAAAAIAAGEGGYGEGSEGEAATRGDSPRPAAGSPDAEDREPRRPT